MLCAWSIILSLQSVEMIHDLEHNSKYSQSFCLRFWDFICKTALGKLVKNLVSTFLVKEDRQVNMMKKSSNKTTAECRRNGLWRDRHKWHLALHIQFQHTGNCVAGFTGDS